VTSTYVFAVAAALVGDALAILLVWSIGYHQAKREFYERQRTSFVAINMALSNLTPNEFRFVASAPGDKIVALLSYVKRKRTGDAAAREAEFQA
jgi:hypothetical protein